MANIGTVQLLWLYVGGENGTKRLDASTAGSSLQASMIKVLVDATTFSVLTATNQAGTSFNMLTVNNLTAKEFNKGDLVFAPAGGYH